MVYDKKTGNFYAINLHYFSRFHQIKTRPYIQNLRHSSLDQDVISVYWRFQMSNYYSKRNIDVQKIKVKNAFFEFSALSHICL